MGGCRCTYKNCTQRSDGATHMFHYPVFDKVRCHQWLTNAQKLEFLNLKVSQLKNRVVCQHHFRADGFMNYMRDKLTFDAVPTLDGPYCDTNELADIKSEQGDISKLYTITLDDIENDFLTFNDKKANFSVKYGDFLTNCEVMDLDSININGNCNTIKNDEGGDVNVILNNNLDRPRDNSNPFLNKIIFDIETNEDELKQVQITEVPLEFNEAQRNLFPVNINKSQFQSQENQILEEQPKRRSNRNKKIIILDETKIEMDPVPVPLMMPNKLERISPSAILTLPNKRRNVNKRILHKEQLGKASNVADLNEFTTTVNNIPQEAEVSVKLDNNEELIQNYNIIIENDIQNNVQVHKGTTSKAQKNTINCTKHKKENSLLKNKIPPERMAAIEEKRKFNMKLRDIIASCIDKLDNDDSNKNTLKDSLYLNQSQNVSSYFSKEPELPSLQDYTVAFLEARMKKMEDILLHKIDQNTQRITELKTLIKPDVSKKVAHTQTVVNEHLKKKHLYEEISKFLSPEVNSVIYEELFINTCVEKGIGSAPSKRRKYR